MMKADAIGLYVHIPFCVQKCNYCDFCSFAKTLPERKQEYVRALCREIDTYKGHKIRLDSIFFGGGTPSLLTSEQFAEIIAHIRSAFEILPNTEFTLEANPKTLTDEKLDGYIRSGVNRISLGLQSIHENELKILGRIHNFSDFLDSYNLVRSHGIENVNVDLMYGIPEQTKESFKQTLDKITELSPEHISVYGLILEEGTPFFDMRESLVFPTEDEECDMYYIASDALREAGYLHYEISNYAKQGYACKHNLKYWRDEEYIGVGLTAYSYFNGQRFGNGKNFEDYLNAPLCKPVTVENIDSDSEAFEYAMLHLRLSRGFDIKEYKSRFGKDFLAERKEIIDRLIAAGYLKLEADRLFLTESGFYVSNSIIAELI